MKKNVIERLNQLRAMLDEGGLKSKAYAEMAANQMLDSINLGFRSNMITRCMWKKLSELIIDFLVEYDLERVIFAKNADEAYGFF